MKHSCKRVVAMLLALAMILSVLPSAFAAKAEGHFTDVPSDSWYAEYVKWAYEHEPQLMNGMTATEFVPNGVNTRAMVATVLYRYSGSTETGRATFADLDPNVKWYQDGIYWAQKNGVVNGMENNTFCPNLGSTREQIVTMLYRYAKAEPVKEDHLAQFADPDQVSKFAKDAMNWAASVGIIQGDRGSIYPKRVATRAEFAKMLYVFEQLSKAPEKFTITLVNPDGTKTEVEVEKGGKYTPKAPEAPEGKTFAGWATKEGGEVVYKPGEEITVEEDLTLYPIFVDVTPVTYTITLYNGDKVFYTEALESGSIFTIPADPTEAPKEGDVFVGWALTKDGEAQYRAGDKLTVTADITLYAIWRTPVKVTVTLHNGDKVFATETLIEGTPYTIPADPTEAPAEGQVFLGWALTKDGEIVHSAGDTFAVIGNLDLYAVWGTPVHANSGHRDVFNHVADGQLPTRFETTGDWALTTGAAIDNWGGITELRSNGNTYPSAVRETWDHFVQHNGGSAFLVYGSDYEDVDFTTHMRIPNGGTTGAVVFRYQDEQNYYFYELSTEGKATIGKVVDGQRTDLQSANTTVNAGVWYNLRVQVTGDRIIAKINNNPYYIDLVATDPAQNGIAGTQLIDVTDTDAKLTSGKVGYWANAEVSPLYAVFAVANTGIAEKLENEKLEVTVGAQGEITELYLKSDKNTNFVSNGVTHHEDAGENHFLGELIFTYTIGEETYTATTGNSNDIRGIVKHGNQVIVIYNAESEETNGIRHFTVKEIYTMKNDHLEFNVHITNDGKEAITILDLGLPVMWNNHWQFQSPYTEYASAAGNYISYNGSWIQIESAGGGAEQKDGGEKIVFLPDNTTDAKLEYRRYFSNEQSFGMAPETYYVYSANISKEGQGYLKSTSKTLNAGEADDLSFQIRVTDTYLDTEETIYEAGSLDVQVNPGMVLPDDVAALVDIHTTQNVTDVKLITENKTADITGPTLRDGDHKIYSIKFHNQGRNDVEITYGEGKKSVLQFWVIDNVADAMQMHTDFLMDVLRITPETDPGNPHMYSFGEYNNSTNVVDKTNVGTCHCSLNDYEQMYDGPAFIAEKLVFYPEQDEIEAIDQYLIDLVYEKQIIRDENDPNYGRLYHGCCDAVCWGDQWDQEYYNGHTICKRVYNAARIHNTFFSMYKAAKYYGDIYEFRWDADEYLYWAGMIAYWGEYNSGTTGVMGEQTIPDIIEALRAEGMGDLANRVESVFVAKGNMVSQQAFPFGSEFSVDRTGEEGAYFSTKYVGNEASMNKAINKIMAWICKVPVWYWQTTGRTNDSDWWIFQYTVSLQAAALKDYYFDHEDADAYWSMIYPAAYSSFAHIKTSDDMAADGVLGPNGTMWWNYWPTRPYNWDTGWPANQTGEADIDLWGGLQLLSTDVVLDDPSFGLTAYGGVASKEGDAITVIPTDGLYTRLNIVGGAQIELQSDKYSKAELTLEGKKLTSVKFTMNNFTKTAHSAQLTIEGMVKGGYLVLVDGTRQAIVNVGEDGVAKVPYQLGANESAVLEIVPYEAHEGALRVALVGDDALEGKGTSDWETKGVLALLKGLLSDYEVQSFINTEIKDFAPDIVILMSETEKDFAKTIQGFKELPSQPIVYVVTTANETVAETVRKAAAEEAVTLIDADDLISKQPDLVADNALNNNGAKALAGKIYTVLSLKAPVLPAVTRDAFEGFSAVDYDHQTGAHYADVKTPDAPQNTPYIELDANGSVGFNALNVSDYANGLKLHMKNAAETTIQVYRGDPENGGKLIGARKVTANPDYTDVEIELFSTFGTVDLYIVVGSEIQLKTVALERDSIDHYQHDFSYDDGRWVDAGQKCEGWGVDVGQRVYWIDVSGIGVINDLDVTDFVFEFDFNLYNGHDTGGVVFRFTDYNKETGMPEDGLALLFDKASGKIRLVTMPEKTTIDEFDHEFTDDFEHLKLIIAGDTVRVYDADGNLLHTFTDAQISAATGTKVGVWTDGESIDFKNFDIHALEEGAPIIMEQPQDATAYATTTATFTVEAGEDVTYQWQRFDAEAGWVDIPDATGKEYTTDELALTDDGTYFRVVVTKDGKSTKSEPALLTVTPMPTVDSVTIDPETADVRVGHTRPFTATVTGTNNPPTEVEWEITSEHKPETTIDNGVLTVAKDETAATLTIEATSTFAPEKKATATVTVLPELKREDVVLHYLFNDGDGETVHDFSENEYDGTITGGADGWGTDGYAFNGTNTVQVPQDAELLNPNMTIIYEVKRTGEWDYSDGECILWFKTAGGWDSNGVYVCMQDNTPVRVTPDGGAILEVYDAGSTYDFYPIDKPVQVAISINSDTGVMTYYKDGDPIATFTGVHVSPNSASMNVIGQAGYNNDFLNDVTMSDFMIFHEALNEEEVKKVYNGDYDPDLGPATYTGVEVKAEPDTVGKGGETTLTATVQGTNYPKQAVTWALDGDGYSSETKIIGTSNKVTLHVGADETNKTVKVKATASAEEAAGISGTVTVNVETPVYSKVTVSPDKADLKVGDKIELVAVVEGQYLPIDGQDVTWDVTKVDGVEIVKTESGSATLSVGADVKPDTKLTVTATSKDPQVSGTATITTIPADLSFNDVVVHYIFDEGSGDTVKDYSNNHFDGKIKAIEGDLTENWKEGGGYNFDGNSYIDIGGEKQVDILSKDMTILIDLTRTGDWNGQQQTLLWSKTDWNTNGLYLNLESEQDILLIAPDGGSENQKFLKQDGVTSSQFFEQDKAVQLVIVVNSADSSFSVYKDGDLVEKFTGGTVTPFDQALNYIGYNIYDGGKINNMTMNEFLVLDDALTTEQVSDLHEGKIDFTPVKEDAFTLHYAFNETEGKTVTDHSSKKYNGTVVGNATWNEGLVLDGNTYIEVKGADGAHANLVSSNMTLVFKVKRTGEITADSSFFWGKGSPAGQYYDKQGIYVLANADSQLCVWGDGGEMFNLTDYEGGTAAFYEENKWTEIALTIKNTGDNSEWTVYRNGELVKTGTGPKVTPPEDGGVEALNTIGAAADNYNQKPNNLTLGKYMILHEALTPVQVQQIQSGWFAPEA